MKGARMDSWHELARRARFAVCTLAWLITALPINGEAKAPAGRYTISAGGGVVTDNWTKLQWQRAVVAGKKDWSSAKSYCSGLSLEGSGWRLPTVRELHGLVDKQESVPSIDKTAFPNTPSATFWSASARAGSSTDAWVVVFNFGVVNVNGFSYTSEVRCVRGS